MENTKLGHREKRHGYAAIFTLGAIFCAVFIVWLFVTFIVSSYFKSPPYPTEWKDAGYFGDMFGSVNSLFSALAFLALISAVYLQKKDIDTQRKAMTLQLTDSTFFNYLSHYHKVRESLQFVETGIPKTFNGIEVLRHLEQEYTRYVPPADKPSRKTRVHSHLEEPLSGYYSYLLEVLRFIDEIDEKTVTHKSVYARVLKSILSPTELFILKEHSEFDAEFKKLAVKYNIIEVQSSASETTAS